MKLKKRGNQSKGLLYLTVLIFLGSAAWAEDSRPRAYVGSDACIECHEVEYENFTKYARKSRAFQSLQKMKKGLTSEELKECYVCHTTGYGKPGGFISLEQTPELKDAGCEVCHGPAGHHAETEDPDDLTAKVTIEICGTCHTQERVTAFRYKPMVHGGAH
jgi:hypothetical protein